MMNISNTNICLIKYLLISNEHKSKLQNVIWILTLLTFACSCFQSFILSYVYSFALNVSDLIQIVIKWVLLDYLINNNSLNVISFFVVACLIDLIVLIGILYIALGPSSGIQQFSSTYSLSWTSLINKKLQPFINQSRKSIAGFDEELLLAFPTQTLNLIEFIQRWLITILEVNFWQRLLFLSLVLLFIFKFFTSIMCIRRILKLKDSILCFIREKHALSVIDQHLKTPLKATTTETEFFRQINVGNSRKQQ